MRVVRIDLDKWREYKLALQEYQNTPAEKLAARDAIVIHGGRKDLKDAELAVIAKYKKLTSERLSKYKAKYLAAINPVRNYIKARCKELTSLDVSVHLDIEDDGALSGVDTQFPYLDSIYIIRLSEFFTQYGFNHYEIRDYSDFNEYESGVVIQWDYRENPQEQAELKNGIKHDALKLDWIWARNKILYYAHSPCLYCGTSEYEIQRVGMIHCEPDACNNNNEAFAYVDIVCSHCKHHTNPAAYVDIRKAEYYCHPKAGEDYPEVKK